MSSLDYLRQRQSSLIKHNMMIRAQGNPVIYSVRSTIFRGNNMSHVYGIIPSTNSTEQRENLSGKSTFFLSLAVPWGEKSKFISRLLTMASLRTKTSTCVTGHENHNCSTLFTWLSYSFRQCTSVCGVAAERAKAQTLSLRRFTLECVSTLLTYLLGPILAHCFVLASYRTKNAPFLPICNKRLLAPFAGYCDCFGIAGAAGLLVAFGRAISSWFRSPTSKDTFAMQASQVSPLISFRMLVKKCKFTCLRAKSLLSMAGHYHHLCVTLLAYLRDSWQQETLIGHITSPFTVLYRNFWTLAISLAR